MAKISEVGIQKCYVSEDWAKKRKIALSDHSVISTEGIVWDTNENLDCPFEALASLCENIFVSWIGQCFLELVVLKALSMYKFSWISGIDDNFFGLFLWMANSQFQIVIHIFRYWLGDFYESREFQLLSSIKLKFTKLEPYWFFYCVIFLLIFCSAFLSITGKAWFKHIGKHITLVSIWE